jgi:hypothetical protein
VSEEPNGPTYAVNIESSAEGFHAVVTRDGQEVYRGGPRAERRDARRDASLFVIMAPEERRTLRWDDERGDPDLTEWFHYTVCRGAEALGWVTAQNPLSEPEVDNINGTFHPGPACEPFLPLFRAAMDLCRRIRERRDLPEDEAIDDALMAEWNAATEAITALGLSVGTPPQPVVGINLYEDYHIELYLVLRYF